MKLFNIFKRLRNLETKVAELQAENNELKSEQRKAFDDSNLIVENVNNIKSIIDRSTIKTLSVFDNYIREFIREGEFVIKICEKDPDKYLHGLRKFFEIYRIIFDIYKDNDHKMKEFYRIESQINSEQFLDQIVKRIKDKQVS